MTTELGPSGEPACFNCKHYRRASMPEFFPPKCEVVIKSIWDPVLGWSRSNAVCKEARGQRGKCGPLGSMFEEKESAR